MKYHDSEQQAVFGFICGMSSVMYCKANIKVTSLNVVTLLQFCCILPYFKPKINTKAVGCCKSQYWRGLTWPLNVTAVISHIIKSRSFPDKSTERSTLLCSFVLFQMLSDILRSTNPETGLLKLKTQQA